MNPINQLTFGPTPAQRVGMAMPTDANKVDLASVVLLAGRSLGLQDQEIADYFGISKFDFSAAFSQKDVKRNKLMKQPLPLAFARQIALVLCEQTGLAVGGADAERHALADLLAKCADFVRVMGR